MTDAAKKILDLIDGHLVGRLSRASLYVSTVDERRAELTEHAETQARAAEAASLRSLLGETKELLAAALSEMARMRVAFAEMVEKRRAS